MINSNAICAGNLAYVDFSVGILEFRENYHSPKHNMLSFAARLKESDDGVKIHCRDLANQVKAIDGKSFAISHGEKTISVVFKCSIVCGDQKFLALILGQVLKEYVFIFGTMYSR